MAWKPPPDVAIARDVAEKFGANRVIIFHLTDEMISYISYGKTKAQCREAGALAETARDAIYKYLEKQLERTAPKPAVDEKEGN